MLMLKGCAALSAFHTKSQSIFSFFGGYCLWQYATGSAYVLVSLRAYGYAFFFGGYCLWQYATASAYVLAPLRAYGYVFCDSLAHLLCQRRRSYVGNVLLYAPLYSG